MYVCGGWGWGGAHMIYMQVVSMRRNMSQVTAVILTVFTDIIVISCDDIWKL